MTAMNFLTKYGVIIPAYDILGSAIFPRLIRESSIVREHNLSGIQYEESVTVDIGLRIYVQGQSLEILKSSGAEIKYLVNVVETQDDAEEEKPRRRGRRAASEETEEVTKSVKEIPTLAYVEYVLTQVEIEKGNKFPIITHPRFQRLMRKEETADRLTARLKRYAEAVSNIGSNIEFEGDNEPLEEDEAFGGARLSQMGMQAQLDAHRQSIIKHREYADNTLTYLEENILNKSGTTVENVSLEELNSNYGNIVDDNGPLFASERILSEIGKEILAISLADVD